MPPKKKDPNPKPDGPNKDTKSKDQLIKQFVQLRKELRRVREARNYFQLERDMIHGFWENTQRKKEEIRAEQENIVKTIEDDECRHQVELKMYKQKMKHLLCEHQNTISKVKADISVTIEEQNKEFEQIEKEICEEMRVVKVDMQNNSNEDIIKELEMKHVAEMAETRKRSEIQLIEIKETYETKMKFLKKKLENMRKNEVMEREDLWNSHITVLKEDHNKALDKIQEFFDCIPPLIEVNEAFKADINEMKMKLKEKKRDLIPVLQDNKRLAEQLHIVKEEHAKIEKQMKHRVLLKGNSFQVKEKQMKDLKQKHDVLMQKISKVRTHMDELRKANCLIIDQAREKAAKRRRLLETKVKEMTDRLGKTESQLQTFLSSTDIDQAVIREAMNNAEKKLNSLNDTIRNLEIEKAQISKKSKDLLLTYEAKLRHHGETST